jgi:large repetitive protein
LLVHREGKGQIYAVAAAPGGGPRVEVYNAITNALELNFFAYDSTLRGGVSVATGDVTGSGVEDVITGAGVGGGPVVEVFNGQTGALMFSWYAYDPSFRGGVWVASEDLYGTGVSEIVTGPGNGGGPLVEVWSLASGTPTLVTSFMAFESSFRGGVTVATGVGNDGRAEITMGAGPGGAPRVITYDAITLQPLSSFYAYESSFNGGVYVAAGDVLGTGTSTQILVGPGIGGGPRLEVFDEFGNEEANVFASVATSRNGLTVAAIDRVDASASVLVGAGQGAYRGDLSGETLNDLNRVSFFEETFLGGLFVG